MSPQGVSEADTVPTRVGATVNSDQTVSGGGLFFL